MRDTAIIGVAGIAGKGGDLAHKGIVRARSIARKAGGLGGLQITTPSQKNRDRRSMLLLTKSGFVTSPLRIATNSGQGARCEHMLLYLNAKTWTSGRQSELLAAEVRTS